MLIDTGNYTYNAADDFLNDIPTAARLGGGTNPPTKSVSLTTKAILTGGIFDADNVTIPAVSGADPTAEAVVLLSTSQRCQRSLRTSSSRIMSVHLDTDGNST